MLKIFRRNKRDDLISKYADYNYLKRQANLYIELCRYCDSLSVGPDLYVKFRNFLDQSLVEANIIAKTCKANDEFMKRSKDYISGKCSFEELMEPLKADFL